MKAMPKKTLQYPFDARFTKEDFMFWNKTHTFADILHREMMKLLPEKKDELNNSPRHKWCKTYTQRFAAYIQKRQKKLKCYSLQNLKNWVK